MDQRRCKNDNKHTRKLITLHEIKVLDINTTQINANLMESDLQTMKINIKEEVEFHHKEN